MSDSLEAFAGGVAVITGAGSGIGEATARELAAADMRVVLADIASERIEAVAADIAAAGGVCVGCAISRLWGSWLSGRYSHFVLS